MNTSIILSLLVLLCLEASASCEMVKGQFRATDPVDKTPWSVPTKEYRPQVPEGEKLSTIFLISPITGETILDRKLARKFCNNGFAAYILNVVRDIPFEAQVDNFNIHDQNNSRALTAVRAAINTLEKDPAISGDFGMIGMSLGGIFTAYVTGAEPRIKASVIVVGGADLPGILTNSDQEFIKKLRDARMKKFQLSLNAYHAKLTEHIGKDALSVINNIRPDSVYFFLALNDTTVPTANQRKLVDHLPSPMVWEMRGNHVHGIIKAGTIHAGKILRFFQDKQ